MLTAYCPATLIGKKLKQLEVPQDCFAAIVNVSTGALSEFLSGKHPLPNQLAEEWLHTLSVIEKFRERMAGLPLNWHLRTALGWRERLKKFEKGQLLISVIDLSQGSKVSDEIATAAVKLDRAIGLESLAANFGNEATEDNTNAATTDATAD